MLLQIDPHERQNRQDKLVDIDEGLLLLIVFEHRTKVRNNIARPVPLTYNSIQCLAHLFEVGLFQPSKCCFGVCQYGCQRLPDLVRY